MTRWLWIALAVSACAKGKDSAPAPAADTTGNAPVAEPPPVQADPGEARQQAREETRNHGGLGVSAHTDSFDVPGEGGSATTKGAKPKADSRQAGPAPAPGTGGEVKVGGGGGTRGDDAGKTYRALIVSVTLDGKPAPAALVQAVKANATKIQACYDKTLTASPRLVGELAVSFTVLPTGTLTTGAVGTSTVKQDVLERCVITALQATKLARPLGKTEATATVTIMFKAK